MGFSSQDDKRGAIRVAIVGNDPFGRRDLADRLERRADLEVVENIDSVDSAMSVLPRSGAHVVVIDDHLLGLGASSLCRRLDAAGCRIPCIVHASLPPDSGTIAGWAAAAVVLKSLVGDQLEAEIRRLADVLGERPQAMSPAVSSTN